MAKIIHIRQLIKSDPPVGVFGGISQFLKEINSLEVRFALF
jgi:hypothetical protein